MKFYPNPDFLASMDNDRRKAWHDALVGGDYRQGRGYLYDDSTGVYGASPKTKGNKAYRLPKSFLSDVNEGDRPDDEIFTTESDGDAFIAKTERGLAVTTSILNDDYGFSFKNIAKLVYPEAYGSDVNIEGELPY